MDYPLPELDELEIGPVLAALADPTRRYIVLTLLERDVGEHPCTSFDLDVARSTMTHHWRVLRAAGLISQRDAGNRSWVRSREGFDSRFPGLLAAVARSSDYRRSPGRAPT